MKRLFQVAQGGLNYFESKVEAKAFRDKENSTITKSLLIVSKGPDHMGNHGRRVPATYHRGQRDSNGNRNTPARSR